MNDVAKGCSRDMVSSFDKWTPWRELGDGRQVRAKLEADDDTSIGAYTDFYGTFHDASRGEGRPRDCDGAARKLRTRQGMIWWQPPADVKSDREALAKLTERVTNYWLEHWSYVGVVVEVRSPACSCCGEVKTVRESLWGIESDAGDYFAEVVADLIPRGAA